jgi:hypothetical protein
MKITPTKNFDQYIIFTDNMVKAESDVAPHHDYPCLWTPPCNLLLNTEMKKAFDKILIDT